VIVGPYVLIVGGPVAERDTDPTASFLSIVALLIAFIGYFALSYRWWGRTPAMMLGRLHVVSVTNGAGKLPWSTSFVRSGGLILGYACGLMTLVWLITTASSRTKQGPHDSMAKTVVLSG